MKFYICGITHNKHDKIKDIIDVCSPYVDGFVWTDHYSTDGTYEILEKHKKEGKIYQMHYTKDHDVSANFYLRQGHIKDGDWIWVLDSTDLPNKVFLERMRDDVSHWDKNGVGLVYGDRPWLFKYFDTVYFHGTPHWGTEGHIGKVVYLSRINGWRKESYLFNRRDTLTSGFLHPARYYFEFGRSNHLQLLYLQFGGDIWKKHEELRINFRLYCKYDLGIELNLDSLINYLKENAGKYPPFFEEILETEVNLKDMFRLFVLNQPWEIVASNRFNFSYFKWKETGEIDQDKNGGYEGLFNQYRREKGLDWE